jgi:hypothetical protein
MKSTSDVCKVKALVKVQLLKIEELIIIDVRILVLLCFAPRITKQGG